MSDENKLSVINTIFIIIILAICALTMAAILEKIDKERFPESSSSSFESSYVLPTPTEQPAITSSIEESSYVDIDLLLLPRGSDGSFKAWEDKLSITDKTSAQYALILKSETNPYGFVCYDGYYLVAMGTYYAHNIGDKFIVCFDNCVSIPVMIGDVKADKDTVDGMYCIHNGSIIEFIIDKSVMKKEYWIQGDLSCLGFEGKITMIRRVG